MFGATKNEPGKMGPPPAQPLAPVPGLSSSTAAAAASKAGASDVGCFAAATRAPVKPATDMMKAASGLPVDEKKADSKGEEPKPGKAAALAPGAAAKAKSKAAAKPAPPPASGAAV